MESQLPRIYRGTDCISVVNTYFVFIKIKKYSRENKTNALILLVVLVSEVEIL